MTSIALASAHAHARKNAWDNARLAAYCRRLRASYPVDERQGRILFVQIPQVILGSFNRDIALRRGYYAFPPTGLQYLYEAIKHRGIEVRILDLNYELLKRVFEDDTFDHNDWPLILENALAEYRPAFVGVSCLFDSGIAALLETLRRVRRRGDSIGIAGGVIATYEWKRLIAGDLSHFAVRGEGENKLNFLLDHLLDRCTDSPPTPGIHFNDGDTDTETEGGRDEVQVQGSIVDSYSLVPIGDYCRYGALNPFSRRIDEPPVPFAAIQFARGCRAECTFCAVRDFMGKGVRSRSVADVLAEMEFLHDKHGVRHFEWLDDDLLFYRREVKDLLRRIVARGWRIHWSANNGLIAASIDDELMGLMRDSGCIGFKIGIETGNPEMLRRIRKPGTHSKFLKFSARLANFPELFVGGNFIVGLPGETFAQMMDSFRFALDVDLDWAAMTICQVIRGASAFSDASDYFEEQMRSNGATSKNFIPTRHSASGQVEIQRNVLRNLDVFRLPPGVIPSEDQVKEIWFTFNLLVNYVNNRNLRPGGRPQKFINWITATQRAYPNNPYMLLFLGIAHRLLGRNAEAVRCREQVAGLADGEYWRDRFAGFYLDGLLADFPPTADEVQRRLAAIRHRQQRACADWMAVQRAQSSRSIEPGPIGAQERGAEAATDLAMPGTP